MPVLTLEQQRVSDIVQSTYRQLLIEYPFLTGRLGDDLVFAQDHAREYPELLTKLNALAELVMSVAQV